MEVNSVNQITAIWQRMSALRAAGSGPTLARRRPPAGDRASGSAYIRHFENAARNHLGYGARLFSSSAIAATICAGTKGLSIRMLSGTPCAAHSSALSPVT